MTKEGVVIPMRMFKEMLNACYRMEQVIATLEVMADEETMEAIRKSKDEIKKGEFIECSIHEVNKVLK